MAKTLALIHTGAFLPAIFTEICREAIPDVKVFNILDESLIGNTIDAGGLTASTRRRLAGYIQSAEEAGANVVMVTCSSIGPAVDGARPLVEVPVLRVDLPMAEQAVRLGRRIGVIATVSTTLKPTSDLVADCAANAGKDVQIVEHLCEGAFQAVIDGDTQTHDRLVAAGLAELMSKVDVVVLAQASMARIVEQLAPEEKVVPILSSPRLGVEAAKKALGTIAAAPN